MQGGVHWALSAFAFFGVCRWKNQNFNVSAGESGKVQGGHEGVSQVAVQVHIGRPKKLEMVV